MTRVLILHASIGLGHLRAATALESAFQQRQVEQVWVEDFFEAGLPLFGKLYAGSYTEVSEKLPELWSYYYERVDQGDSQIGKRFSELVVRLGIFGLDKFVRRYNPDVIVCTHFLPLDILLSLKRQGKLNLPIYCVVTDYTGHILWAYSRVDGYFVGSDETARLLAQRGVPESLITVTGIPVDPEIAQSKDPVQIRQAHQITDGPVITLIGSGLNPKTVRQMVTGLLEREIHGTLLVVAGRNKNLQEQLTDLQSSSTLKLRMVGFIDYLDDLSAISALVVTKAGGLIISELMARQTPLLIVDPVPGQEEWNADYVVATGAGVQVRLTEMVPVVVENLLNTPAYLEALRAGAGRAGQPHAALDVADAILARVATKPA
ncbi:MAG: MGDG synthase family glycosyltransferase [Chloroflexaceae bacterium]